MNLVRPLAVTLAALLSVSVATAQHAPPDIWRTSIAACSQRADDGDNIRQVGAAFADCMADDAVRIGAGVAINLLNEVGKRRFGAGFAVNNRLRYATRSDEKVLGDIDLVMPLNARGDANAPRAFFMQHGITRWADARGEVRHDTRFGGVHRFAANGKREGIYGISAFVQENREYGHRRMVAGLDYAGAWGSGGLNWYRPLTDWQAGRAGYEERALEGVDLALNLNLTTTIDLRASFGRWEQQTNPDTVKTQGAFGFGWRPHAWFAIGANLRDIGSDSGSDAAYHVRLEIPLGGGRKAKPKWHGFGVAGGNSQPANIWRGVGNVTRIEYAERRTQAAQGGTTVEGVTVRFLQSEAVSGNEIRIEVVLPSPAIADTPLTVRLEPGTDGKPAVPGEDYVDEPIAVTVRAGETNAIATVRLLENSGMTEGRSLNVSVRAGAAN